MDYIDCQSIQACSIVNMIIPASRLQQPDSIDSVLQDDTSRGACSSPDIRSNCKIGPFRGIRDERINSMSMSFKSINNDLFQGDITPTLLKDESIIQDSGLAKTKDSTTHLNLRRKIAAINQKVTKQNPCIKVIPSHQSTHDFASTDIQKGYIAILKYLPPKSPAIFNRGTPLQVNMSTAQTLLKYTNFTIK